MCFSAEASFAAAALLLPAGVYCTRIAARKRPAYLPLAVIPILFSIQQVAEGLVWVGLGREDAALVRASALVYLAFALALWPFWAPFSVLFLTLGRGARMRLGAATLLGLALGGGLYLPLVLRADEWLYVTVVHHSVRYNPAGLPAFDVVPHEWWDAGYLLLVLVPLSAMRSDRRLTVFFLTVAASAVLSLIAFRYAFVSVWCFFAAVLSVQLCLLLSHPDRMP